MNQTNRDKMMRQWIAQEDDRQKRKQLSVTSRDYRELAANIIEKVLISDMDQTELLAEILVSVYYDGNRDAQKRMGGGQP